MRSTSRNSLDRRKVMITEIYPKMIQENNRERKHYTPHPVNREEAFELIQEVLDGREAPMGVR